MCRFYFLLYNADVRITKGQQLAEEPPSESCDAIALLPACRNALWTHSQTKEPFILLPSTRILPQCAPLSLKTLDVQKSQLRKASDAFAAVSLSRDTHLG